MVDIVGDLRGVTEGLEDCFCVDDFGAALLVVVETDFAAVLVVVTGDVVLEVAFLRTATSFLRELFSV